MAQHNECRLEDLLGRRIRARDGSVVGRIEEMRAAQEGRHYVISEYHIGPSALFERLAVKHFGWALRGRHPGYRAAWDQVDVSDPTRPRLICEKSELRKPR